VNMELRNNICSLCCSLQPKNVLARLMPSTECLSLLLGSEDRTLLACSACMDRVDVFTEWLLRWRRNIELLRELDYEQERQIENQCANFASLNENSIDISLTEDLDECKALQKPENFTTITKYDLLDSPHGTLHRQSNNQIGEIYHEQIQCAPLNLVKEKRHHLESSNLEDCYQDISVEEFREDVVSPPHSSYQTPIIIPSMAMQVRDSFKNVDNLSGDSENLSQEERRRHRNREASRRYREKARGDPALLKKMREQQNKRQKKYYARLKGKKTTE